MVKTRSQRNKEEKFFEIVGARARTPQKLSESTDKESSLTSFKNLRPRKLKLVS